MRASFGLMASLIIFFAFFIVYALVSPAWDTWYAMAFEANSENLAHPLNFLNICWQLLPLAVLLLTILWYVVAGLGEAANPGKLLLAIIILILALMAMMLLYVSFDPIISSWSTLAGTYAGIFAGIINIIQIVWYNYCIPLFFAVLIWVGAIAISTEAETVIA